MTRELEFSGDLIEYLHDHLGGTACAPAGGTVSLTLPTGARSVYFRAEGGAAYYNVNAVANGTVTPGYIPSGGNDMIFACDNLGTVSVYAAAGVVIHTQFYSG